MGYFFTLLYLLTAYITPHILFGPLSDYHIEIIVVLLAILCTIPNLPSSGLGRAPQSLALAGITLSIMVSIAQTGWLGGMLSPLYSFMQPAFAFFLVAINCRKRRHLQWIILCFGLGSLFFMVQGILDLRAGVSPSAYLFGEGTLRRLRGLGFVNDPNDFAQLLVSLIPAVFLWRQKNLFLDFFLIGVPIVILITGMYLTHSRGGMIALIVVVLLSVRRKIGVVPAAIISGILTAGLFAAGFSGGRDVSMDAGADRLDLWYDGMEMIKAHPLFGIGLNHFIELFGITAHNSVIICASELGLIGLFFWVFFVFSTSRMAIRLGRQSVVERPEEAPEESLPHLRFKNTSTSPMRVGKAGNPALAPRATHALDRVVPGQSPTIIGEIQDTKPEDDTAGMARLLLLSLAGILTAGWFLSRALSLWLFMYCGMIYAVSQMTPETKAAPKDAIGFLARWSVVVTIALLLTLYIILRVRNIVGH